MNSPFTEFSSGDHMDFTPDVKEGDIIFFPSQLLHYANPNTSDKERVIVSFNMMSINEIGIYEMKYQTFVPEDPILPSNCWEISLL